MHIYIAVWWNSLYHTAVWNEYDRNCVLASVSLTRLYVSLVRQIWHILAADGEKRNTIVAVTTKRTVMILDLSAWM